MTRAWSSAPRPSLKHLHFRAPKGLHCVRPDRPACAAEKNAWRRNGPARRSVSAVQRLLRGRIGGPDGSRTRDLMNAIHARSQLRYWPMPRGSPSLYRHHTARRGRVRDPRGASLDNPVFVDAYGDLFPGASAGSAGRNVWRPATATSGHDVLIQPEEVPGIVRSLHLDQSAVVARIVVPNPILVVSSHEVDVSAPQGMRF
jgi:hypothetical protein